MTQPPQNYFQQGAAYNKFRPSYPPELVAYLASISGHHSTFNMTTEWNFEQLIGYLSTWSASKEYQRALNHSPIDKIHDKLLEKWSQPEETRTVTWLLSLKVWQK